jgi:hypothetical protein
MTKTRNLADLGGGFIQAGTGAVQRTVESKLQDVVHINDFNGDISAAIDATPSGGILQLGAGTYTGKIYKVRNDITIRGAGTPSYASNKLSLTGGTIIQGTLHINGSRVRIESLGVDCGSTACTNLNGGVGMNGLVIMDPSRTYLTDVIVRDVIVLGKDATSPFHCFLFEGVTDSHFQNLHSRYTQWGIVFKTKNSTASGLYAYASSSAAITVKSDSYAIANNTLISNVTVDSDDYTGGGAGILIYAATADSSNVSINNFITKGFAQGVKAVCDTRGTYVNVLDNVTVANGNIYNAATFGIEAFGALNNCLIDTVNVYDTVSGNSIKVWSDGLGISLSNIVASSPVAINNPTNVDLAGRFSFDQLYSIRGGDRVSLAGINIAPDSYNRALAAIGGYRGNLYVSGVAADVSLANGWTSFFSTVTIKAQSNRSQLFGRVSVPATPWTGKEVIGTIPAALAPVTAKYFVTYGYAGSNIYPVYVSVAVTGTISCDFLNTATLFPATITHIGFDGLSWLIHE